MQFHITTDYAIRMVVYLSQYKDQIVSAQIMSEELGITYPYIRKVAARLKEIGYIESTRGPMGGYRLTKEASNITLYDIIKAMEGDIHLNRCLDEEAICSRYDKNVRQCIVHKFLESVQNEVTTMLKSKRVHEM